MPLNATVPVAPATYSQTTESQFRGQLNQNFQYLSQPQAIAIFALMTPQTITNGCIWFVVNEGSGEVEAYYQDSTGAQHGPIPVANYTTAGLSTTIVTAKLTGGGANGSQTFTNGVLTAQTPAT